MKALIYTMVFLGAALMVYNIIRYGRFIRKMKWLQHSSKDGLELYFPMVLLILFLAGYLFVGILGKPDLVISGILFGGSIFVWFMMRLLHFVVERVNRDEQLQKAMEDAQRASRAKTVFLSNMSHDIRTPMNAIIGYTQLASREGVGAEEMRSYLGKINASGQYLLALINDVLEMSRIESGRMELEEEETDLQCLMTNIRDMFTEQMEEKHIHFAVGAEGLRDRYVYCDRHRLNRVLMNLISNAYKFTPEGGSVAVSLTQTASAEAAETDGAAGAGESEQSSVPCQYELRVRDTGIGMSPEFASRIFEAFERERSSTDSGIQGTGLGMSITKNIVDLMGGTITIDSEPGKGTEFCVTLAFRSASGAGAPECVRPDDENCPCAEFAGSRLLLAEDNEINREIAVMVLRERGFEIDVAENGREALDMVSRSERGYYAAVLMDIQMPVMNGYDASKAIRALPDPDLSKIPIIAMTANAFQEDIRMEREAGMNAHVTKPIDLREMMTTLGRVLGGK